MDHIQYAKNVLDPYMRQDLKILLTRHCYEVPHYNFAYKGEAPTNFIEQVIRHVVGDTHHIEYWVSNIAERQEEILTEWFKELGHDPRYYNFNRETKTFTVIGEVETEAQKDRWLKPNPANIVPPTAPEVI